MKKRVKIPVIVVSSVVGVILLAVIILCCITVRPLKSFMDYDTVNISTTETTLPDGAMTTVYKKKIDRNLRKTGFSVMHATLEFVGSYGPEFVKTEDEEGDTVRQEVTIAEAREACAAKEDSYMLEFVYNDVRTFKVGKSKVQYDRVLMNVHTTKGELKWVTVYPYLSSMDVSGSYKPEASEYRINPVRMRMNTSPLYIALGEIAADYT